MSSARVRPVSSDREDGVAMVTILLVMLVLMMLGITTLEFGLGSQNLSRRDQDWNASLAAAEAGIDDYLLRLNENGAYWQYSKTNPPPSAYSNPAFASFTAVPGPTNESTFRYTPDSSRITVDGTVKLTSTGQVRKTQRTVSATLRRRSFIDYLYYTDFETMDPALYTGSPFTAAQAQTNCAKYYYSGRSSSCTDINFVSADTINGPLHSNDAFLVCGSPKFNGDTSTSYSGSLTGGVRYRRNSSCSGNTPTFSRSGDPKQLDPLSMPPSNSSIRANTDAGTGGCLYTGPTKIVFNSNGTMTVSSPFSKNTRNGCVTNGTGALPSNGVIYVQNVPSSTSDPNYTNGCPYSVSGRAHPLGLPITNDITTYGCRNGDAFVEGTLKGQVTLATENNIDITWNLTFQGGLAGSDLLGLVANNYVEVYHPVSCTSGTSSGCNLSIPGHSVMNNLTINAAILSVNHSFRVQNWTIGAPLGTLTVNGAIAQRYRGAVGTNSNGTITSGFAKAYVYDQRLKYLEPPYFLDPVAAAWQVAVWSEVTNPAT
ncbi:MAG: hypothetical protein ACOYNI_10970 [Acidimicrobiia bacterium]